MRKPLTLIILLGWVGVAQAITMYPVQSGNWTITTTWNSSTIPTATDDVKLNTSYNVQCNTSNCTAQSIDMTGGTGWLNQSAGSTITVKGSATLVSGLYQGLGKNSNITFNATGTLTTAGNQLNNVIVNAGGGVVTLGDNLTQNNTLTLTQGTLDTNNQTVSCNHLNSTASNTRVLNLTNSIINISNGINIVDTNLTLNPGNSVITLTNDDSWIQGGHYPLYDVNFLGNSSTLYNGNYKFHNLTVKGKEFKTCQLKLWSSAPSVNTTLTISGNSAVNRLIFLSNTLGTQRTINVTGATLNISNCDFRDIAFINTSVPVDLSTITGGSGDCGGNSNITFTPAKTLYWYQDSGSFSDVTKWRNETNGTVTIPPLPQDTARFNASSFSTTGKTVTQDMPCIGSVDWTGAGSSPTFAINSISQEFYGINFTLISGMSLTGDSAKSLIFYTRNNVYVTTAGKWVSNSMPINSLGYTLTILDDLSGPASLTCNGGTFEANNFNVSISRLEGSGTFNMGNGNWTINSYGNNIFRIGTGAILNCQNSTIVAGKSAEATTLYQTVQNRTFNNFIINASGTNVFTINGNNTFSNLQINASRRVNLTAGSTQNASTFSTNGTTGSPITLNSTTIGTPAYINSTSGTSYFHYTNITDINASGGATFDATDNCVNVSNAVGFTWTGGAVVDDSQVFIL